VDQFADRIARVIDIVVARARGRSTVSAVTTPAPADSADAS
jgi:hypothetical protein